MSKTVSEIWRNSLSNPLSTVEQIIEFIKKREDKLGYKFVDCIPTEYSVYNDVRKIEEALIIFKTKI